MEGQGTGGMGTLYRMGDWVQEEWELPYRMGDRAQEGMGAPLQDGGQGAGGDGGPLTGQETGHRRGWRSPYMMGTGYRRGWRSPYRTGDRAQEDPGRRGCGQTRGEALVMRDVLSCVRYPLWFVWSVNCRV